MPKHLRNPFLSAWLSAANASAGAARGLWLAEAQRQQATLMREMAKTTTAFWTRALAPPPRKPPRR